MDPRTLSRPQDQTSESNFISNVYRWMSIGLFVSMMGSLWLKSQPALQQLLFTPPQFYFFGLIIAELALVLWLSMAARSMSAGLATGLYLAYSFLNGITLFSILFYYTTTSVVSTFAITAGTFGFFSIYGATTHKDLTSVGALCGMGLLGVIIASVVNIFLKSSVMGWVLTFVGIAVFLGLIAYDTQKLKAIHAMGFESEESKKRVAILGALTLYLDFINLFLLLLRVFGRRRD